MLDGTLVGLSGVTPDPAGQGAQFSHTLRSKQYPLAISVAMPRAGVVASYDDVRRIGMVMSGGIALIILVFALLISRRDPTDPMADMARAIRDNEFRSRTTSRWSTCSPAGCSAPRCWCVGGGRTALSSSRTPSCSLLEFERAGAGIHAQADAPRAQGNRRGGRAAPEHEYRLQCRAAALRRRADPQRRRLRFSTARRSGCRRSCWN